jgi:S1-C subfamily serine protease
LTLRRIILLETKAQFEQKRLNVMNPIIKTIAFSATFVMMVSAAARAGEPLGSGAQAKGGRTLVSVLRGILPAVIEIEARGRVVQTTKARPTTHRNAGLLSKPMQVAAGRDAYASGSGVVIDAGTGLIVTNNHVVGAAERIIVRLADGRELDAVRVGRDPDTDIAVIRIKAERLAAIPLGDSNALEAGESVVAIGNPLRLGQTVTAGIVSGLHRGNVGIERFEDFIQTDAAIYPGNSGGALVDLQGRLVGINTAFIGPGKGNPGLGFAIPSNMVRAIVDQIVTYGEVRRGDLGATLADPGEGLRRNLKLSGRGAMIVKVDDKSAADHAGLKSGDVVTAFDGTLVHDAAHLRTKLALLRAEEVAELAVLREGRQMVVRATVADRGSDRKVEPLMRTSRYPAP